MLVRSVKAYQFYEHIIVFNVFFLLVWYIVSTSAKFMQNYCVFCDLSSYLVAYNIMGKSYREVTQKFSPRMYKLRLIRSVYTDCSHHSIFRLVSTLELDLNFIRTKLTWSSLSSGQAYPAICRIYVYNQKKDILSIYWYYIPI